MEDQYTYRIKKSRHDNRTKLLWLVRADAKPTLRKIYEVLNLSAKQMNTILNIGKISHRTFTLYDLKYRQLLIFGQLAGISIIDIILIMGANISATGKDDRIKAEAADPEWLRK